MHFGPGRFVVHNKSCFVVSNVAKDTSNVSKCVEDRRRKIVSYPHCVFAFYIRSVHAQSTKY